MSEIKIVQLTDKEGQKISPYIPASAVYVDVNGEHTNAENLFGGININALSESFSAATDAISGQCEMSVAKIEEEGDSYSNDIAALQVDVERLNKKVFPFGVSLNITTDVSTMQHTCKYTVNNSEGLGALSVSLVQNGTTIYTGTTSGATKTTSVSWGKDTFTVTASAGGMTASATSTKYLCITCAGPSNITASILTGNTATKYSITSASFSATVNTDDTKKYIWIAVPSPLSINRVTSGGFDVTMRDYYDEINISGVTYRAYRNKEELSTNQWILEINK